MKPWITTTHAGVRLGLCRETVLRLIHEKKLHARRPGRYWRVSAESVEAYKRRTDNGAVHV
jgi:excisionase family DNA binding protein